MKERWLHNGKLDYEEYPTIEELRPYCSLKYNGSIEYTFFIENQSNIIFIFEFFIFDKKEQELIPTEKIFLKIKKEDFIGIKRLNFTNYDPVEGLIEEKKEEQYGLIYKFINPTFFLWDVYEEKRKKLEILYFLGSNEKYEIMLKKGTKLEKVWDIDCRKKINKKFLKKININYFKHKKKIKIMKKYFVEFINKIKIEEISYIFYSKIKCEFLEIDTHKNVILKIKINNRYNVFIKYNWNKIFNYQYIKKEYFDFSKIDEFKRDNGFYFFESRNSKFYEHTVYNYLLLREYVERDYISHNYVFDNIIFEIIVLKDYYPSIFIEKI